MGFKPGEGLGKHGQGITTPVEAVKRKGKAAVGAYGTERSERSLADFPVQDSDEEEDKKFKEELSQWKKKPEVSILKNIVYTCTFECTMCLSNKFFFRTFVKFDVEKIYI